MDLHELGWDKTPKTAFDNCLTKWTKQFVLTPLCPCNTHVVIEIRYYIIRETEMYEMVLWGERPSGAWAQYKLYGLDDFENRFDDYINELISAWEAK